MMKFGLRSIFAASALLMSCLISATPAAAQATRTWISGVGDDVNPCSRTAPCKTFAGAISKTAASGEINCLDPGGFGGVTITKSITLSCEAGTAGVLVAGSNGITINAGPTDVIRIRGLDMVGLGTVGNSLNAILFLNGGSLYVSDTRIDNFGSSASGGYGIAFTPSGNATLVVDNVDLSRNGGTALPSGSGGILVQPGAGATATGSITNSRIGNGANFGIRTATVDAGATINMAIANTVVTNAGQAVLAKVTAGAGPISIVANDNTISQNTIGGIRGTGTGATILVGTSTITGNTVGVSASGGGTVSSYGNNRLNGNATDGTFSGTVATQ